MVWSCTPRAPARSARARFSAPLAPGLSSRSESAMRAICRASRALAWGYGAPDLPARETAGRASRTDRRHPRAGDRSDPRTDPFRAKAPSRVAEPEREADLSRAAERARAGRCRTPSDRARARAVAAAPRLVAGRHRSWCPSAPASSSAMEDERPRPAPKGDRPARAMLRARGSERCHGDRRAAALPGNWTRISGTAS